MLIVVYLWACFATMFVGQLANQDELLVYTCTAVWW